MLRLVVLYLYLDVLPFSPRERSDPARYLEDRVARLGEHRDIREPLLEARLAREPVLP